MRLRRQKGTAALETAVAIPFLVILIAASAEFAYLSLVDHQLGYAARAAARYGITGQPPADDVDAGDDDDVDVGDDDDGGGDGTPIAWCDGADPGGENPRLRKIREIISDLSFGVLKREKLCIELLSYNGYEDVGKPEPFADIDGDGAWSDGEAYTDVNGNGRWDAERGAYGAGGGGAVVVYTVRYDTPPLIGAVPGLPRDRILRFTARIPVRNEPF